MGKRSADKLQGTLDLLVLKCLDRHDRMHGYGITVYIQQTSGDSLRVEEGSLYPALHRMEQDGWIKAEWGTSENNRKARYYSITRGGREQLAAEEQRWRDLSVAVDRFLRFA